MSVPEEGVPSYLNRLTQAPLLAAEEEKALSVAAQDGCRASRERLVESNMRLVINIAKSYHSRSIPLEDLIQEGAIGLMYAIERFDPTKGFRFSTYATHWIRQTIGRAIDSKAKAIRLPAHISQSLRRVEKARQQLTREMGHEPTLEHLAEMLGITPKRLVTLIQASQELVSLDVQVGENEGTTLGSLIKDDNCNSPETMLLNAEIVDELHEVMQQLNDRERKVVTARLRYGDTDAVKVREELSEEFQVSRERVRQLEVQAIKKLRQVAQRRRLREYLSS
ncbi:MAG: sigma-70 family RNA polymerase sigma factor [Fimbriimonadaceae bacterium]|nr:sigma-70 family RNA polymerase sigma factor [Fimbriimonadaceae bacterium]